MTNKTVLGEMDFAMFVNFTRNQLFPGSKTFQLKPRVQKEGGLVFE